MARMRVANIEDANGGFDPSLAPFVREFPKPVRAGLMRGAVTKAYRKGDRILNAGEVPTHLGIVLRGMVELCGTTHDPDCGVLLLTRGDLLVPMAALYRERCLTSATALSETRIIMLDRGAVVQEAGSNAQVAMGLARIMGAQWRMAVRHIIDLKSRTAAERLASILLRFVDYEESATPQLLFSKKTLAARLGVSRETLSRIIQVVAENGIILRGSEIVVRDREMAEAFSGPEPYVNRSERRQDVYAF